MDEPGDETAHMRHVGDAARVGRLARRRNRADAAHELQHDPEPEHEEGRHGYDPGGRAEHRPAPSGTSADKPPARLAIGTGRTDVRNGRARD